MAERLTGHGTAQHGRAFTARDVTASLFLVTGCAFTFAARLALPGPEPSFAAWAKALAFVTGLPELLGVFSQRFRARWAHGFLNAGGLALAFLGFVYLGRETSVRVVLACFLPGALYLGAALVLAAPRIQRTAST